MKGKTQLFMFSLLPSYSKLYWLSFNVSRGVINPKGMLQTSQIMLIWVKAKKNIVFLFYLAASTCYSHLSKRRLCEKYKISSPYAFCCISINAFLNDTISCNFLRAFIWIPTLNTYNEILSMSFCYIYTFFFHTIYKYSS